MKQKWMKIDLPAWQDNGYCGIYRKAPLWRALVIWPLVDQMYYSWNNKIEISHSIFLKKRKLNRYQKIITNILNQRSLNLRMFFTLAQILERRCQITFSLKGRFGTFFLEIWPKEKKLSEIKPPLTNIQSFAKLLNRKKNVIIIF